MGIFYIVATPIGNLEDITKRALRTLSGVDLILCEDTRVTKVLLDRYQIKAPTLSYHQHSKLKKVEYIIQLLREGKNLALVSDAGTPGISDPGSQLVARIVAEVEPPQTAGVQPLPGPCALTAAASISGFPMDKFVFMGFPPIKNKRKKFFEEITALKYPVILYESPYRIVKTLNDLETTSNSNHGLNLTSVVVCRELTKKFETIYRGSAKEIAEKLKKEEIRGEFVIVTSGK